MIAEYFRPTINYNSWTDRFSSTWTFLLLLILAIITALRHYLGPNITCNTPPEFTLHMTNVVDQACWLGRQNGQNVKLYSLPVVVPLVQHRPIFVNRNMNQIKYQWLPIIFIFQALLFRLPDILLRSCESSFGFGCQKVTGLVSGFSSMTHADRQLRAEELSRYLIQLFNRRFLRAIPFGMITIILAFVKLMFFVNAVVQFTILETYLVPDNVTSYVDYIFQNTMYKTFSQIASSPNFQREVICDLKLFSLGNKYKHTFHCFVPVNDFNEQLCFLVWIWLLIVCVASGTSGFVFLVKSALPMVRQSYISKYLTMGDIPVSSQNVSSFSSTVIGQDGVIILRMIGDLSSDILVKDIVINIWKMHNVSNQLPTLLNDDFQHLEASDTRNIRGGNYYSTSPTMDSSKACTTQPETTEMEKMLSPTNY